MRPLPEESYDDWCNRVQMFEHGNAMMEIAQGKDIAVVMEEMSRRIMQKIMHPAFQKIRESSTSTYDVEKCRESYEKNYLDKNSHGIADHIVENT